MTTLDLTVYTGLKNDGFVTALKKVGLPREISVAFSDIPKDNEFSADRAHIAITDDKSLADKLAELDLKQLHVVFVGKAKLTEKLEDVWDTDSEDEIALRFSRLVRKISAEFFAWFYEHTLYTTIDTVPDMMWFKRLDGIHMMVNQAFTEVVHKTRDDIIGKDHFYIWDAPRPAEGNEFACAESEETAIRTGKMFVCDEPVKTREGMKQLTTYKTPVYDMFGNVFGTVGVGHDVTNFSNLGIELSILVENLPFPMIIFTADMKVVRMNEAFMQVSGVTPDEIDGFDYEKWRKKALTPVCSPSADADRHLTTQEYTLYLNKETLYFKVRLQEIRDFFDNVSGYFLIMSDITYQHAYEESILKAANTDMLTGMYNRRFFYNYLSEHSEQPMTLFYMDLDRFKYVNDHYGHAKGDEVLIKTARVIKTRYPNAMSARLGGDEFAIVTAGIMGEEEIKACCLNIESTIQRIFTADGLPVTMSIGVATYDGSGMTMDEFMHLGDRKMYDVKKRHHNEDYE